MAAFLNLEDDEILSGRLRVDASGLRAGLSAGNDRGPCCPSPSTDLSLPPMDNEENDAPPEVRYVRSLFSDFQEFVEHIGWLKISYIYPFIMRN